MNDQSSGTITLSMMRQSLYSAVVADALDEAGYTSQSPRVALRPLSLNGTLVGRAKTTLWVDMAHEDPRPYELELRAVDSCQADDVFIAAGAGSMRSAIWGELLSTAARNRGCVGAIVDGATRDIAKIEAIKFPVFARGTCPLDSRNRHRVVEVDVPVQIDSVCFSPGDLVVADADGVVVVPRKVEDQIIRAAWEKVDTENQVRSAIQSGRGATEAFSRYGIL
jgi:regulator of RNase E activity RraA